MQNSKVSTSNFQGKCSEILTSNFAIILWLFPLFKINSSIWTQMLKKILTSNFTILLCIFIKMWASSVFMLRKISSNDLFCRPLCIDISLNGEFGKNQCVYYLLSTFLISFNLYDWKNYWKFETKWSVKLLLHSNHIFKCI